MNKPNNEQVSVDTQYEQISKRVADLYAASYHGLKFFVQILTAIVGGSFWLNSKLIEGGLWEDVHLRYARLTDWLLLLVFAVSALMTIENTATWSIWRRWLAEITSDARIKMPMRNFAQAWYLEASICLGMFIIVILFWFFNPFLISK
ncbi:MAG TPA: hypothetical protein VFI23_10640 [Rhizomicrobium sp.]|nr:hypothetical protein [Rhizomicrobium sp.]